MLSCPAPLKIAISVSRDLQVIEQVFQHKKLSDRRTIGHGEHEILNLETAWGGGDGLRLEVAPAIGGADLGLDPQGHLSAAPGVGGGKGVDFGHLGAVGLGQAETGEESAFA